MPGRLRDRLRAAAYRFRLRQQIADAPVARVHHIANPWHAVSISTGLSGYCPQVSKLFGKRVLSMEAPTLPLRDCPMKKQCGCRFRHHSDRREDPRRAGDTGFPNHNYYGPERREKIRGRRVTDV
jgi:hypothetical protein